MHLTSMGQVTVAKLIWNFDTGSQHLKFYFCLFISGIVLCNSTEKKILFFHKFISIWQIF